MKKAFSTHWISSSQPRKQRKFIHNAPLHKKHRFLSSHLSSDLRKKYGKRNLPLRKGDEVLVMRGSFKKKKAKISSVNLKNTKVYLEGLTRSKKDGTKVNVPFHPSVLLIQSLNLDDKERQSILARKNPKEKNQQANKEIKGEKNASNKRTGIN